MASQSPGKLGLAGRQLPSEGFLLTPNHCEPIFRNGQPGMAAVLVQLEVASCGGREHGEALARHLRTSPAWPSNITESRGLLPEGRTDACPGRLSDPQTATGLEPSVPSRSLHILSPLVLRAIPRQGRYCVHFVDEETEAKVVKK